MSKRAFKQSVALPVSVEEAFRWHERPDALWRLIPPWESVTLEQREGGIRDGARVVLVNRLGPLRLKWVALHDHYQPPHKFRDTQKSGPFASWTHEHLFFEESAQQCRMEDSIEYALPFSPLGDLLGAGFIRNKIWQMFAYRHQTTRADLTLLAKYRERATMRIAVSGASGLVGRELTSLLTQSGHDVMRLVRRRETGEGEVFWDPANGEIDDASLEGVEAVVHLAGESIAEGRWNERRKQKILDSRVEGTKLIANALAKLQQPPRVFACASAIGYYGDAGADPLDESGPKGAGFLADVVDQWEDACLPAVHGDIRTVNLRFGVILSPKGGALAKMLTPFRMGVGGRLGSGKQYFSWIGLDDTAGAILHTLMTEELRGPVNIVAPNPATNLDFTKTLGRVLNRPTIFPAPAFALRLALGEMADEMLLSGANVQPAKLLDTGYEFRHPELEDALRSQLGKQRPAEKAVA